MQHTIDLLRDDITEDIEERATIRERLVLWLLKHPYQRAEDVALALNLHPSSAYRHLAALTAQGLTESVRPSIGVTNVRSFFYLTTQGIQAAAHLVGAVPEKLARMWEGDERSLLRLLPRLHSLATLQTLINSLVAHAPRALAYPGGYPAAIRWHWCHDYQHSFLAKGKQASCRVDAALVFARQPSQHTRTASASVAPSRDEPAYYTLFLLIDPGLDGTSDLHLIRTRLEQVLRFRESAERWSHYHTFPPLLVMTSSQRSREVWQWCASEAAAHLRLAPLQGAVIALPDEHSIQSAWSLPWQTFSARGPCRLRDLLFPMSKEAVPPGLLAPKPAPLGTFTRSASQRTQTITKGHFTQRAEALFHQPPTAIRPEHETTALLSLHAHRRHLELLRLLYTHPLLSKEELAILLHQKTDSLARYLYDLRHMECVSVISTACGHRLCLSQRGLRLMAAILHVSPAHLCESSQAKEASKHGTVQRGISHLLHTIHHTTGIYQLLTQLEQAAQTQQHEMLWWETGARCARRYFHQGRWHNLFPDASLAYQAGARTIRAWIEWDEGTMHQRNLASKMHAYAYFVRSRQWLKEGTTLPMLIIVVPDKSQEMRIRRIAIGILQTAGLIVRSTTATRLTRYDPLAPIWLPILPLPQQMIDGQLPERQGWLDLHRDEEKHMGNIRK